MSELVTHTPILHTSAALELREASRREVVLRLMRYGEEGPIAGGVESFAPGAFAGTDPTAVVLRSMHEAVIGRGLSLEDDGLEARMVFRISQTPAGDEALTLVADGALTGASVGFLEVAGGTEVKTRNGVRHFVRRLVSLREASLTFIPTYPSARVLALRAQTPEHGGTMLVDTTPTPEPALEPEPAPAPTPTPAPAPAPAPATSSLEERQIERLITRALEERDRRQITPPARPGTRSGNLAGEWFDAAIRIMRGDRLTAIQERALADILTTANPGMVPDAVMREVQGIINPARPFLSSTREVPAPATGMNLVYPKIVTRPTVGLQATEKTAITWTVTAIETGEEPFKTYAGGGDLSIQILRRADASFFNLYMELLAEAYAKVTEAAAIADLIANTMSAGGIIAPEDLALGASFTNSQTNFGQPPDTIWFSSAAIAAFINAHDSTNRPLYPSLGASNADGTASAGAGVVGPFSGLRPVYTPGLDPTAVEVIVGPSRAFMWAEDGTFTLQADNPTLLGRDVALAGMIAFAPLAPLAFTSYTLS
jgi:HK97 family phage prohead protease